MIRKINYNFFKRFFLIILIFGLGQILISTLYGYEYAALTTPPDSKEFINGAMKMISGFDWIDKKIHYPEKLIDFCLKSLPSNDGCDLVDIVYVLYMCTKQTEYRKKEIIKYFDEIISLIHTHYHESYYGFSYYMNNSQTHYYGVNITKGQSFPDIHGTTLLIWALSMIFEINEINSVNWKTLKP